MTSIESPEQNEYQESFKRFKTLFIVGAACFCVGVTVVILGNRFQLYEVQRLGIIFSSFGIGWIVLAVSYLVYMKWCFIPGESENSPQQVVERSVGSEGSIIPRTLGRQQSSPKFSETSPPPTEEKTVGKNSSLAGRSLARSTSLVPYTQRALQSVNGSEKGSVHSSRKFEKRSYSLRYPRDRAYRRDCKRLTSFKNFGSPLSSESKFDKRKIFVNSGNNRPLERNVDKVPFQPGQSQISTAAERYFERTSCPEKHDQSVSLSSRQSERPLSELRNSESALTSLNKGQPSLIGNSEGQRMPAKNFERQPAFLKTKEPLLVQGSEGQMVPVKNFERPATFVKHFYEPPNWNIGTKMATPKNSEMQHSALENSFERKLSKSFEKQPILDNCKRQSIPLQHSYGYATRSHKDSLVAEETLPSVQKDTESNTDASASCRIDLDTQHERSCPPDYYEVVLSMRKDR